MEDMQQPRVTITPQPGYKDEYSNSVQVRVSLWDFFLQFGRLGSQTPEEVVIEAFQGVYLSPPQAKALHRILGENLAQYEQAFGEIKLAPGTAVTAGSGPHGPN
jgi:flagellar protein FlaG